LLWVGWFFVLSVTIVVGVFFVVFKRRLPDGGTDALRDVLAADPENRFANANVQGPLVSRFVHARVYRRPYTIMVLPV